MYGSVKLKRKAENHKRGITPLHAGIMHAGYHGNILVGKKQENCPSLSL